MAITFVKKAVAAVLGNSGAPASQEPEKQPESASTPPAQAPAEAVAPEVAQPVTPAPSPVAAAPSKPIGTVEGQTLMDAIKEFANRGPKDKRTLMVIKKDNSISYKVSSHDLGTGRTVMVSTEGIEIRPIITPRENDLYYPMWR